MIDRLNKITVSDKLKKHPIQEVGLSGTLLQFIAFKTVPKLSKHISDPNYVSFTNFILIFIIFFLLIYDFFEAAAFFILLSLFLDLVDGSLARYLNKTSKKGEILDSLADLSLWLSVIAALFIVTDHPLLILILIIYCLDLYLRLIILDSEAQKEITNGFSSSRFSNLKIVFNHFDSLAILSAILVIDARLIFIWIIFEFLRRFMNMFKRFLKLRKIFF